MFGIKSLNRVTQPPLFTTHSSLLDMSESTAILG